MPTLVDRPIRKTPDSPKRGRIRPAADLYSDEIIVDHFAGGGGASEGIEQALNRAVDVAINHDAASIEMHAANHPNTTHIRDDVFKVDVKKILAGRKVGLAWFSPDCKHFSRAKGGEPVSKKIRGLAWVVIRFAKQCKAAVGSLPRVIMLENVREFQEWGPLVHFLGTAPSKHDILTCLLTGKDLAKFKEGYKYTAEGVPVMLPDKTKKGETFKRWVRELRALGYTVDWRPINAADHGVTTHRRRLFLVARCDGKPIRWPTLTHGKNKKKYRPVAKHIDWNIPCPSIFLDKQGATELRKRTGIVCKRPLAQKTNWRIAVGIKRFVIEAKKPFIVQTGYGERAGQAARIMDMNDPIGTIVGSGKHAVASPFFTKFYSHGGQWCGADAPIHTLTAKERMALTPAYLVRANHGGDHLRGQTLDKPLHGITAKNGTGVVQPTLAGFISNQNHGNRGADANGPAPTITTQSNHLNAVEVELAPVAGGDLYKCFCGYGQCHAAHPGRCPQCGAAEGYDNVMIEPRFGPREGKRFDFDLQKDVPIQSTIAPIIQQVGHRDDKEPGRRVDQPINTLLSKEHAHLTTAHLVKICQNGGNGARVGSVNEPAGTIVTKNEDCLVTGHLIKMRGDSAGSAATDPLPTITSGDGAKRPAGAAHAMGAVAALITQFYGGPNGNDANGSGGKPLGEPLPTITGIDHSGLVAAFLYKAYGTNIGQSLLDALPTVTADGNHLWQIHAILEKGVCQQALAGFWRVYAFLCEHLGKDAPLPLITIKGQLYLIVDIGMRMLVPRELFLAQGFPPDYILTGSQHSQVARCGNSVPPELPKLMALANVPEMRAA